MLFKESPHSVPLNAETAAAIKALLKESYLAQHHIAAIFKINQGRISEINTGKRFSEVKALPEKPLMAFLNKIKPPT